MGCTSIATINARRAGELVEMRSGKREELAIFLVVLSINIALSVLFVLNSGRLYGDALSRTASAFFVFFNNDSPKLTSMGSIWLPLPVILQMPLVLFGPLATTGLAGAITSSVFSAISIVYLDKIFRLNGFLSANQKARLSLLGIYWLNPMVLFYSINGMTEIILAAFLLGVFYHLLKWLDSGSTRHFLKSSLLLSLAVLVRYEAWFVAFFLFLFLLGKLVFGHEREKTDGLVILYALPALYAISLWFLYNWLIMGDPLYFERGFGSFSYQAGFVAEKMSVKALLLKALGIFPFAAAAFVYAASKFIKTPGSKPLLALSFMGSIIGFNLLAMVTGTSFGWLRQFFYLIPLSMASLVLVNNWSRNILIVVASLLLVSTIVSANSFRIIELAEWKKTSVDTLAVSEVADYIRSEKLDGILMDAFYGYSFILQAGPNRFVDSYDNNFTLALDAPRNYSRYVFAFDALYMPDMLLAKYPSLAGGGRPEVTLLRDFNRSSIKAYRIERAFEKGAFSVENLVTEDGIVQFVLRNYDDAQQSMSIALGCEGQDGPKLPFHLESVGRLETREMAMPLVDGCADGLVLEVNGSRLAKYYKVAKAADVPE